MPQREVLARIAQATLRAILYLRISDLTDTSTSIPRQEKAGHSKVDDLGAEVVKIFKDVDKSGYHTHVERPDWDAALSMLCERLADVLIVFKVDRATRQGIPQASEIIRVVYETGCRFISIADGIDSENEGWELQLTIAAHQAHRESKNTATRVADLRADERDAGRWMGSRPYGFLVTPERKLELHEEEAEVVRAVARKLLNGESLRSVAARINAEGHDSPRWASRKIRIAQLEAKGEPLKAQKLREKPLKGPNSWSWPVVRNMVLSPLMTGYLPHKGEIYRHSRTGDMVRVGPEIISLADYTRLRAMFGTRVPVHWTRDATPGSKSKDTGRAVTGLLSDFLYCGECGARMSYDAYWIRNGKPWPRYRCARRQMSGRCPGTLMKGDYADALVTGALVGHLTALEDDSPALLAIAERWADLQHPERRAQRRELEARIQNEEEFLDRLEEEKLNGLFQGKRGEERFRRRYDASNERLEQYEGELAALPNAQTLDITFLRDSELFAEAWEGWPLSEKREILGLALNRAWLFKARTSGVKPSVDRFRFWWVGDPEPKNFGVPLTLTEAD
ncbi:recombinase family protein [Streptomyces canus]|uniref:recombinase family protein n=1 Tax=Streptomyces canus TaxID=58343 RepID=UPI002256680A|nr:recombinase family protein [Streptomyces canus]MCX4859094.1 recombinase family protein [Streptomyces canus]WSW35686.1 recombinase family protein [Streptomyces canus]